MATRNICDISGREIDPGGEVHVAFVELNPTTRLFVAVQTREDPDTDRWAYGIMDGKSAKDICGKLKPKAADGKDK